MDLLQKKKLQEKTQSCENGRNDSCKHCSFLAVIRNSLIPVRPERLGFLLCFISLLIVLSFYIFMLESQFYYYSSRKEQKVPLE